MVWAFNGFYVDDFRKEIAGVLTPPSTVSICTFGTTVPAVLYSGRDPSSAQITNGPMQNGVAIGTPGMDIVGNCFFYAPPGMYTPIIDGQTYPPIQVNPAVDDLAALGGASTSSSGQTLQVLTASSRTITNDAGNSGGAGSMTTAVELVDLRINLNPGNMVRFDGVIAVQSTQAAGVRIGITAGSTAQMFYVIRGPATTEGGANQFNVATHREVTVTSPTNGPQLFSGFAAALSDGYVEVLGGWAYLPSSATAPATVKTKFAQASATSGVTTTIYDLKTAFSVVQLS